MQPKFRASQVSLMVKIPPDISGDTGSILGSGRSLGVGNGMLLQYPCLENSMDRGVWQVIVHVTARSQIRWSRAHSPSILLSFLMFVFDPFIKKTQTFLKGARFPINIV